MASPTLPQPYGKYILLNKIAMGGMAEIFRAKTIGAEGFEKECVIKRILPHFTEDEAFVTMFIDEARLSSGLNHPNIVQIYDFDMLEEMYYIAMEYVEGKDLKRVMDVGVKAGTPLSVAHVVWTMNEVCKGLHYAHTKSVKGQPLNIVHRDVSPHNVMVSYDGEVKVMDFGIAKAAARSTKTRAGTVKGKCAYMSPEQARGKDLDARSDMFAVGVMMWEMLTHRRLFAGESDFETLSNVLKAEVPPPSSINPDVPASVDTILLKCLAKERDERQANCKELGRELEAWLHANADADSAELGGYMRTAFAEDIKALEEMHAQDDRQTIADVSAQTRNRPASTSSSHPAMQRASSRHNLPQAPSNDARTVAIDVGAGGAGSGNATIAIDASLTGPEKAAVQKSKAGLWVFLTLLIAGLGGGAYWYFGIYTAEPEKGQWKSEAPPEVAGKPPPKNDGPKPTGDDPIVNKAPDKPGVDKPGVDKPIEKEIPTPPVPTKVKVTVHVVPAEAELAVLDQKGTGTLELEATMGDVLIAQATYKDYEDATEKFKVGGDGQIFSLLMKKKPEVAPVPTTTAAVLDVAISPADAKLTVNGAELAAVTPGAYKIEGFKVGDDVTLVASGGKDWKSEKVTVKLIAAAMKQEISLKKHVVIEEPKGPGTVKFQAIPWADVVTKGGGCRTPCSLSLMNGRYGATFKKGDVTKSKGFVVKAGGTVMVGPVDMTH